MVAMYILCGIMVLSGLVGLFSIIVKAQNKAKEEMLDEMWKKW